MVKDKPNSIRTYDEDGFRKRAACLCVRNELEDEVSFCDLRSQRWDGVIHIAPTTSDNQLTKQLKHFLQTLQILLVTSSSDRERWIVPGGGLEPNEDSSTAAVREVMEEAGVIGQIARCLGSFEVSMIKSQMLSIPRAYNMQNLTNSFWSLNQS